MTTQGKTSDGARYVIVPDKATEEMATEGSSASTYQGHIGHATPNSVKRSYTAMIAARPKSNAVVVDREALAWLTGLTEVRNIMSWHPDMASKLDAALQDNQP